MADRFGKQLLAGVEVLGFDELLSSIRRQDEPERRWFNCAQIDGILSHIRPKNDLPPTIEITSVVGAGGKTHLLYLLTSLAVLLPQHGGRGGTVVIVDADGKFDVRRLAQQMRHRLKLWSSSVDAGTVEDIVKQALHHVYLYKPQSMRGLVDCVTALPEHLLHEQHFSLDRSMSFIAVDSASAFYWQVKAEEENANFSATVQSSTSTVKSEAPVTYADLRAALEASSKALQCPVVLTSRHYSKLPRLFNGELPRQLQPSLPSPISLLPTARFLVKRMKVRKLPPGLSAAGMLKENQDRLKVVSLARFECVVEESGLNLADVKAIRATEDGFHFRIKKEGLVIETADHNDEEDRS